jgi:hypothetical protein
MASEENADLDSSAAALRADDADVGGSIEAMAAKLEASLPGRAHVERRGGGLFGRGAKQVRAVRVELGSSRYELNVESGRLEGFRERQVGGISIKREPLAADAWLAALTDELRAEAERSADARLALERLLL